MSTEHRVLTILAGIADTDQVRHDLDLPVYEAGLLDSLGTVELIAALSGELGVDVSPAEIDREIWKTPRRIVAFVESRIVESRAN
jgi:D-alanine--poly(phosphoribitol) ligase subunit 2